ncbi:helix-turn-helix domain-containing protein [Enterococcus saccharolyticus]|uniref:helix-turn-helix domain-containing protein n=1 Tax=Enterococcus saccharolyticus TaxID=41997 RepID=UPI0039E17F51
MNPYEKIKELAKERKISIRELEKRLGYSNGYFSKWKSVSPNSDGLAKVADYFDVSVDYLLGRDTLPKRQLGPKGELIATHVDDDVSEEDMNDILKYIEFRKNNPL